MAWNRVGKPKTFTVKEFFLNEYGPDAFNTNGTIKTSSINKALKQVELELEKLTFEINHERDTAIKLQKQNIFKNLNLLKKKINNAKTLKEVAKEKKSKNREMKRMF
jgi:transcriptional regulator GlxA family with amidase domain